MQRCVFVWGSLWISLYWSGGSNGIWLLRSLDTYER